MTANRVRWLARVMGSLREKGPDGAAAGLSMAPAEAHPQAEIRGESAPEPAAPGGRGGPRSPGRSGQRATVTRRNVAGITVPSLIVFWLRNRASSSDFSSEARPFFSAASKAFMVGP